MSAQNIDSFYRQAPDSDSVAILVHGFTGSPYDMKELADYLYASGIDVFVVRLAGHGTTPRDLTQYSHTDWWQSVMDAITEVEKEGKRIFLIGYSFGANLVLDMAARYPQRFAGLICLGTSITLRFRLLNSRYLKLANYSLRLVGKRYWKKRYVPRSMIAAFEATGNYARVPLKSMIHFHDFIRMSRELLAKVTIPILLIHSREDRVSSPVSSQYIFDRVGSTYKEMFILPEFNHNPLRSESRDKIFGKVVNFIVG